MAALPASITIKKADGTTDINWAGLVPASGDGGVAMFRSNSVSMIAAFRPSISVTSRFNGPKDARRTDVTFTYPHLHTVDGVVMQKAKSVATFSLLNPENVLAADQAEAAHQIANLLGSASFKLALTEGYGFT